MTENNEHRLAFELYLRKGDVGGLALVWEETENGTTNGRLPPQEFIDRVNEMAHEMSVMRKLCAVHKISGEEDAYCNVKKHSIPLHMDYAQATATQKLLDLVEIDIEEWLAHKLSCDFARKEDWRFINGDGKLIPRGILSYPDGTGDGQIEQIPSGGAGNVTLDGLLELCNAMPTRNRRSCTFLMNRETMSQIGAIKDGAGKCLLDAPDALLGAPIALAPNMPSPAPGSLSIALADFAKAYQIVDKVGMHVDRDPYFDQPFIHFICRKCIGGEVMDFSAIKLLALK